MTYLSQQLANKTVLKPKKKTETPKFPAAQYFQIHFSHLQAQLEEVVLCLRELQGQITELKNQLAGVADFKHPER